MIAACRSGPTCNVIRTTHVGPRPSHQRNPSAWPNQNVSELRGKNPPVTHLCKAGFVRQAVFTLSRPGQIKCLAVCTSTRGSPPPTREPCPHPAICQARQGGFRASV